MATKQYRYDKTGKKIVSSEQKQKEALQAKINASSNIAMQNRISQQPAKNDAKTLQKNREKARQSLWESTQKNAYKYDSQFTADYFADSKYDDIIQADFDKLDFKKKAEYMDLMRKAQAGWNYRSKFEGVDKDVNPTSDALFEINDGANTIRDIAWVKGASEDDIRWLISDMEKRVAEVGKNNKSSYKANTQADLDAVKEYARNNFSSFANEEIRRIGEEMAALDTEYAKQQKAGPDLVAAANNALRAGTTGSISMYVQNNPELREALGYDELAKQYPDQMDLDAELWARADNIAAGGRAEAGADNEAYRVYADERTELQNKLDTAQGTYANLLEGNRYRQMLDEAGFIEGGQDYAWGVKEFEARSAQEVTTDDGLGNQRTETRYTNNEATLDQIVANPQRVINQLKQQENPNATSLYMAELAATMTLEERLEYFGIKAKYGEERAEDYFDWKEDNGTGARRNAQLIAEQEAYAREHPIAASIGSIALKPIAALGGTAAMIDAAFGGDVKAYDPRLEITQITNEMRTTVGEEIAAKLDYELPVIGNVGVFFYNTAMSIADMSLATAMGAGLGGGAGTQAAKRLTQLIMSSGAATDTFTTAIENGDDPQEAALQSFAAGLIEAATEKYSIDALFSDKSPVGLRNAFKYIAENAFTEGTEEIAADILNDAVDVLLNWSDAKLLEKFEYYRNNGYTDNEAALKLLEETAAGYARSGLAGTVSGTAISGTITGAQNIAQQAEYSSLGMQIIENGQAAQLINAGLKSTSKSAKQTAERLARKITDAGLPTDAETAAEIQVLAEEVSNAEAAAATANENYSDAKKAFKEAKLDFETAPADMSRNFKTALEADVADAENAMQEAGAAQQEAGKAVKEAKANYAANLKDVNQRISNLFKRGSAKIGKLYTNVMNALDIDIQNKSRADIAAAIKNRFSQLGKNILDDEADAMAGVILGEKVEKEELELLEADSIRDGILKELIVGINGNWASDMLGDATKALIKGRDALRNALAASGSTGTTTSMRRGGRSMDDDGDMRAMEYAQAGIATEKRGTPAMDDDGDPEAMLQARAESMNDSNAGAEMIRLSKGVTNTRAYANAFEAAYDYGSIGLDKKTARTSQMTTGLTDEQFEAAYNAGQQAEATAAPVAARKAGGRISFTPSVKAKLSDRTALDGNQRAGINALRRIAEMGIVNIEVFESQADEAGSYAAYENGSYNPETNTIRIDINAGKNKVGSVASYALLRTASHELTHFIKVQNPDGYKALRAFVSAQLTKDGSNTFDGLVARKMDLQPDLTYAQAVEEVVADGCEMMLKDSTAIQQLAKENKGLFNRIRNWIKNFVASVKRAFRGVSATSAEARLIKDMDGMQKLWDDALVQAGRNVMQGKQTNAEQSNKPSLKPAAKKQKSAPAAKLPLSVAHIDTRTLDSVKNEHAELFSGEVEAAQIAYAAAAGVLMDDLNRSVAGQKVYIWDNEGSLSVTGQKRMTSEMLAHMKDSMGWTWDDIRKTLQGFIDMGDNAKGNPPVKNTARNRRMEVYLHEMLTEGYTTIDGTKIAPWREYIEMIAEYEGSEGADLNARVSEDAVPFEEYAFAGEFADNGVQYSVRLSMDEVNTIQAIGEKSINAFTSDDIKKTENLARRYFKEMGVKSPFFRAWFGDWRAHDATPVQVATRPGDARGVVVNGDTGWSIQVSGQVFNETKSHNGVVNKNALPYLSYINDIVKKAVLLDTHGLRKAKSENSLLMHSLYTIADIGNGAELLKLYVEEMNDVNKTDTGKRAYQLQNIESQQLTVKGSGISLASAQSTADIQSVADLVKVVKGTGELKSAKPVDARLLNADGTPKVMYHGTPYGGFSVFKGWQYFTENRQYANTYQNPSASSIRGRYNAATNPMTYAVYLSVKNPFDTRIPSVRRIWQNEFYGKWGDGTPLSERGLPDWTEGIDLVEFLEENGYDFDAIILDEGGTGGYGDEVKDRGVSVVVRSSNQIKSATDNIGTFDPKNRDIYHSIRTDSLSDREILAEAFENVAQNDTERNYINQYREKINDLNEKQGRLAEVRGEIRDMMFTPGKRSEEFKGRLNRLKNEAKQLSDYINRIDKRLLAFENAKPLQDVLARERAKVEKQSAEKRRESMARVRDRRNATEIRHKIKAILDDFNRRLKNPTEKSYIPQGFVHAVIAAEELVNTDSGRAKSTRAQEKLAAIQGVYERYKNDPTFAYAYDPIISDMLNNLSSVVGNKTIYQLNSTELQAVYDALKALKKQVTEAVKLKAGDYARTIFEAGREMALETAAAAPLAKGKAGEFLNWQLTPDKFFERLAGHKKNSTWSKVARTFSEGTQRMLEIQREHYYHFKRFTESKEFDKLSSQKNLVDIGLKDADGNTVKVTRGMMLSAYMHLLNEENARGFMYGGFSIPNLKAYYAGDVKGSYGTGSANTRGTASELAELAEQMRDPDLTEEQLQEMERRHEELIMQGEARLAQMRAGIAQQLTQYEKDLIRAIQEWNDGKSQQYINEVTMDLYGIKKASVQNYFPIHRDTAFVNTDFESISRNVNLENWGSLKQRVPSQAPILLTDIAYEMDSTLNQMSRYVGYARAQRDFNKLYNVRLPGMNGSVKKAVGVKFGSGGGKMGVSGAQYIENYIGSITGSRRREDSFLTPIRRNLVRATMTMNLRVAFSQLSAIPKAAAEVGWGNMSKGFLKGGFKAIFSTRAREELAKQNVWFWQRYRGEGGQREFADAKGGTDVISKVWNWVDDKTKGWLLNWCQSFDVMSTVSMWSMAKEWTRKNTNFAEGSAEFTEAANRKYTDIIRNTQAMSTTTERSDLARSTSEMVGLLSMFKSEAFANFNLFYDAFARLRKYNADLKAGKNGVTKADVTAARKHAAGVATSVIIGASLGNAVLKLAINALTHAMNGYRNDEDEVTLKSTLMAIGQEVAGDTAGMIAFGGDVYDLVAAAIMGEKYYGMSDMALSEITEAFTTVTNVLQKEDASVDDYMNAAKKLTFNITNMLGIPAENWKRYWAGAEAWIEEAQTGMLGTWEGGVDRANKTNYRRLYNAAVAGDVEKFDRVMLELMDNGVEEKDALSGFRTQVKEAYREGELTREEATEMLVSNGGKDKNEAYWLMDEWDYTGEENYSKYADLEYALEHANASDAQAAIAELTKHGVKEETVYSRISTMYNDGTAANLATLKIRAGRLYSPSKPKNTADDFDGLIQAIVSGGNISSEMQKVQNLGYSTKNIMTALNSAFGKSTDAYINLMTHNPADGKRLEERILDAYALLGMNREEERKWIRENWIK